MKHEELAMDDDDELQVVVIDNGSWWIKAGFAGNKTVSARFPTVIGRQRQEGVYVPGMLSRGRWLGDDVFTHKDHDLTVSRPMQNGEISNWDDMEAVWHHTFNNELRVSPEDFSVMLTEHPGNPKSSREKMAQIMFETFSVPSFYLILQEVLSLYSSGRTSGLVLDSGYETTHAVPILDSFAINHGICRLDIGGRHLTDYLRLMLKERGLEVSKIAEEHLTILKERSCQVAADFETEARLAYANEIAYELPDGNFITVGSERVKCPEVLFTPSILGVDTCGISTLIHNAIQLADHDNDFKNELYHNIIQSGGNTIFAGIAERTQAEVEAIAGPGTKVKVIAPPERVKSAWLGGSILGSLSTYGDMVVTKQQYNEYGPSIVHRKCI